MTFFSIFSILALVINKKTAVLLHEFSRVSPMKQLQTKTFFHKNHATSIFMTFLFCLFCSNYVLLHVLKICQHPSSHMNLKTPLTISYTVNDVEEIDDLCLENSCNEKKEINFEHDLPRMIREKYSLAEPIVYLPL